MKRFGILLIVAMFGLVLVSGCGEDKESPAKPAAPPGQCRESYASGPAGNASSRGSGPAEVGASEVISVL